MSFEERRIRRREVSRATLDAFKLWLEEMAQQTLPKSALAAVIGYTLRQWAALERYLGDGELVPDNSASERCLTRGRHRPQDRLFAGSDAGGVRAAHLYSLIKRHGIEPYGYLRALFERLPCHPSRRLHELAPAALAHLSHVTQAAITTFELGACRPAAC